MILDSFFKASKGSVTLSGKCEGADGVTRSIIKSIKGGKESVLFLPTSELDKKLVSKKTGTEYIENDESFVIIADKDVKVYADSERAKLYAANSIKYNYKDGLKCGIYYGFPEIEHRSIRVYMPSKKNLKFFKKYIDMLVYLGYNAVVLEVGGTMEFKKHPEINESWAAYCKSMAEFNEKPYKGSSVYCRTKNSVHTFNACGDIYTQDEMRELVQYIKERHLDVIPEVPSLTHSEYILISHPDLRECDDEPYASTACPQNEGLYDIVFDLYDEVINVFEPEILHIGHDEWWVMCVCDKCNDKKASDLFVENVTKCHDYLAARGIKTMMWADKAIAVVDKNGEPHGGAEKHVYNIKLDKTINVLGEDYNLYRRAWHNATEEDKKNGFHQLIHYTADCIDRLPKDIIFDHWYWSIEPRLLDPFLERGLNMIYGNCDPSGLNNYKQRFKFGAKGYSVSNWIATTEEGCQVWGTTFGMGYGAVISWKHDRNDKDFGINLKDTFDILYDFWNRETLLSPHIEVLHTCNGEWEEGNRYYDNLPYPDRKKLTVGNYVVTYKNGKTEKFPVMYILNIASCDVSLERWDSGGAWSYAKDKKLTVTSSVCNFKKIGNKVYYKTVFPLKGEVESVEYIPLSGHEKLVDVKEININ